MGDFIKYLEGKIKAYKARCEDLVDTLNPETQSFLIDEIKSVKKSTYYRK